MRIIGITLPTLALHSLVSSGKSVSTDEVFKLIEDDNVFDAIFDRFKGDDTVDHVHLDGLRILDKYPDEKRDLYDALSRLANTVVPEDLGGKDNGLIFLSGLLNELVQSNLKEIELK